MSNLDKITEWLELARRSRYDARQLAQNCQVSPSQLRRYFSARFGKSPQLWLNELRLWQAARLLGESSLQIKAICLDLFYCNPSHFHHQFKKYFGCTPAHYAVSCRNSSWGSRLSTPESADFESLCAPSLERPWDKAQKVLLRDLASF